MSSTLNDVPPATTEEIEEVIDGVFGLMMGLTSACNTLGLSRNQVGIFCRNTPGNKKGGALWREFTSRRDAKDAPAGYGFANFVREVLAEAGHPLP